MIDPKTAALLMIDMQQGFIDPASTLCVAGAAASVDACARALEAARKLGMRICHVNRKYAADGSDVEAVRYGSWLAGGRVLSDSAPETLKPPASLAPKPGEEVLLKPKFSAFFGTPLHEELQAAGIRTVVLIGTTTPNCIRSTCYDALSLGYNVVIVEDATSSRTAEVQEANIADMAFIGAQVIPCSDFVEHGLSRLRDIEGEVRAAIAQDEQA